MNYRNLGGTGLMVSEIAFGTIPILSGNIPVLPEYYSPDEETAIAVMKRALDLGCNLFDTAIVPEYGDAEIKLGKFAAAVGRDRIIISDKSRFFDGDGMYDAVCKSCENLGTTPDIYFAHQVDERNEDLTFSRYGALDALADLKADGKIRYAGIASHYYDILLRGARDKRVDVLQGSGNILERGMLDRVGAQPLFREKGFLVNKAYAAGILPSFFPVGTVLSGVLSYPVSSVLVGLGTEQQVDQAMRASPGLAACPDFSQVLSRLEQSFEPIPCDRCQRCRCPLGTEIHTVFRQYNYYFLGKEYWSLRKLDLGIAHSAALCRKCTGRPCVKACPKGIDIPHEMQRVKRLVEIHMRNSVI